METISEMATTAELHPRIKELVDYIDVHRHLFFDAVASVPARLRGIKPGEGRWSVSDVVEHVSLIEHRVAALLMAQATAARASGVGPDPETSSVVGSFQNPEAVTDRTRKIVAPQLVQPAGAMDAAAGTEALTKSRAAMTAALHNANGVALGELMQTHPALGTMNMYHWIVALALHDDRHAAQIREIGESVGAS